jgi:hypothetical protein
MALSYLILQTIVPEGVCRLRTVRNVPRDQRLYTGESCLPGFPEDAMFKMNETFPKDIALADVLRNQSLKLVVSTRFKEALESIQGALTKNEALPVQIINHKGRPEKAPYFIIHQLDLPECLDEKKSKGTRLPIDTTQFQFLTKMVLDPARIPADRMLFRPLQYRDLPIVRSDLAEALGKLELSGVAFREIASYEF